MNAHDPRPAESADDGTVVCSCGHANPSGTSLCERSTCRRVLKGNTLAHKTGLYGTNRSPEHLVLADAGRALYEQSLLDAGGRDELIARLVTQHENRAVVQTNIRKLALALEHQGLFDRRGRLRVGWLSKLESLCAVALQIDRTLGLDRKAKHVDAMERVRQAVEEANGR